MPRIAAGLPLGWQIDLEDLGNEHGKPKIQSCNACVSSSMALCVWPCNCYGPHSDHQPDLLWELDLYARLARADAWAFIGPINWYGPTSNFKLLFDRLVCMNGGACARSAEEATPDHPCHAQPSIAIASPPMRARRR